MSEAGVTVEEATTEEAVRLAAQDIRRAADADSLDHMAMHLDSALIWLRHVSPDDVRRYWPARDTPEV